MSVVLLLGLVNGASGAVKLKVDFGYPIDPCNPGEPNNVIRTERTSKADWWIWTSMSFWDVWYHHDGVWEDGSGGGPPATDGIDGTGIHAYIDVGYDGDTGLHVYGMRLIGDGMEPNGLPDPNTGPICNSEVCGGRFGGAGWKGNDGSVLLTFYGLPHGTYMLKSYHNDLVYLEEAEGRGPIEPRFMPAIVVTGDGVTQIHDEDTNDVNVPIYQETLDANLFARGPSVVKFDYVGPGPEVTVEYVTWPVGGHWWGAAAVLNAFILEGLSEGTAYLPSPPDGAVNVHPDVVLKWKPGEWAAQHDVYFGMDFDDVNDAVTTSSVYQGSYGPNEYDPCDPGPLGFEQTYYWRIDEVNEANSDSPWRGLVWSFTVDDGKAHGPSPGYGATEVVLDANLGWSRGIYAAWHDVYFGTDMYAVMDATDPNTLPGRGRQDPCNYDPCDYFVYDPCDPNAVYDPWVPACTYDPCGLEFAQTYYWRIDAGNPNYPTIRGDLWMFSALDYLIVDDMESYCTGLGCDKEIMNTWLDGWENDSGAEVQLGLVVHDGNQSMEYIYDNQDSLGYFLDYYSEVERTFDDPCDWTRLGVKALRLYFYGHPDNDADTDYERMYVGVEDTTGAGSYSQVNYGDQGEDMNDIKKEEWQAWNMAISDFTGVYANDVNKVYIGFGVRGNLYGGTPGGTGTVFFDDIRLYMPRCEISMIAQPEGDLNDDCIVDFKDVKIVAADWLDIDTVEVQAPDRNRLLVEYTFDNNNYDDTSGNERHGIPSTYGGICSISDGKLILIAGKYHATYVEIPLGAANPFEGTGNYTIQMTFSTTQEGRHALLTSSKIGSSDDQHPMGFLLNKGGDESNWYPILHIWATGGGHAESILNFTDGEMHTTVVSYDTLAGTQRYYSEGYEDGSAQIRYWMPYIDEHFVRIGHSPAGIMQEDVLDFTGEIDSVRIYDYVLSEPEAAYLATDGTGFRPIVSRANLYNEEPPGSKAVNFRDIDVLLDSWLEEKFWPEE